MHTLMSALPVIAALGLFVLLSLATLIDPRDPSLKPEREAPVRRRQPRPHLLADPLAHAASSGRAHPAPSAARARERKLRLHTSSGLRWLSIFLLLVVLGGAAALSAAPALAADGTPTAIVTAGQLNVRAGPGVSYPVVTRINAGESVSLLGRNTAATWVKIRLAGGTEGWVNASYLRASVLIADLPTSGTTVPVPTAPPATGSVTATQLEMRSGPSAQNPVVAVLSQGQALSLLGRTVDSAWVKVRAGSLGEGWIPAQVTVTLPGNESGVSTTPFAANVAIGSLPIAGNAPVLPGGPRVSLNPVNVRPVTPVFIVVSGFPASRDIAAVLTSRSVPVGFVVAEGRTDAAGGAQLFFRMPDQWPSGAAIAEASLSLAVGTTDGAVLIWNGLAYSW